VSADHKDKPIARGGDHYERPPHANLWERPTKRGEGFWQQWILAVLEHASGTHPGANPLILGLVAGGVAGTAIGQHSSAPAPQPTVTVTAPRPTVTVTVTASASPGGGGPSASTPASPGTNSSPYWQGQVGFNGNGLNFDTRPPSNTPSGTIINFGGLYSDDPNIQLALWHSSSAPTASQCQTWVTTHPGSSISNVAPGMQICIKTDQGRFGLLHIQSVDNDGGVSATATIWGS
jgi:hypothetical protein